MLADFVETTKHEQTTICQKSLLDDARGFTEFFIVIIIGKETGIDFADSFTIRSEGRSVNILYTGFLNDLL